jgi:hypothetical protein
MIMNIVYIGGYLSRLDGAAHCHIQLVPRGPAWQATQHHLSQPE